ncbi:heparinase II/III domain-containing protein [Paenibacillus paridis]|uniref:heparinase II/III domain-containing protein n=1 Tax=Paenibacillus paridis TaxID=2583376 RepID=UPI00111EE14A|nr:heparinase II/III family protein [Paenibacillus paridis]
MNDKRLAKMRANALLPQFEAAMRLLRQDAEEASRISYAIGSAEYGEWTHYYYCHHDGARLAFDWQKPSAHSCPVCGTVWKGEPFDSAWTSIVHANIGRAVYHMALLNAIEPDEALLRRTKQFLMSYADEYGGYEIHGNIPYNGPGKLFAQTLDEAHWIIDLSVGFQFIRASLTAEEESHIRQGLLEPCVRFLIAHKEEQIHNHAVLITSAIASLGILLGDEKIIDAGLSGEYGLHDQLQRGRFADGLWYEGNVQYHFYAFKSLLNYALMAEGTPWDIWQAPGLQSMFDYPVNWILPNGFMPSFNDAGSAEGIHSYAPFYEIALDIFGDELYRSLLNTAYGTPWAETAFAGVKTVERDSVLALLFGCELAPADSSESGQLWKASHRSVSLPVSGITKLVNAKRWQVIVKHSKFGGEHDHMDRLGLSVVCGEIPLLVDPGTTAYGVPAHYGWFKHTFSHNTVSLNGADQPPADGRVLCLEQLPWGIWTETAVDWKTEEYEMKGRIILPPELSPWDLQAYGGASIRRINVLTEHYLLDMVKVDMNGRREVSWMNHFSGMLEVDEEKVWQSTDVNLSRLDQQWLKQKKRLAAGEIPEEALSFRYKMEKGSLKQHLWSSQPAQIYSALTPDNPPDRDRTSMIMQIKTGETIIFAQVLVYELDQEAVSAGAALDETAETAVKTETLEITEMPDQSFRIAITTNGVQDEYSLVWAESGAQLNKWDGRS